MNIKVFSNILIARAMSVSDLQKHVNPLLQISSREEAIGIKHVFQTELTKDTIGCRVGGPIGLWGDDETFIDNDCQIVMERLNKYYN